MVCTIGLQFCTVELTLGIQGGPKTDTQFYCWDNFGNSAPILTIFHCYKHTFMACKREVLPPTKPSLCVYIT